MFEKIIRQYRRKQAAKKVLNEYLQNKESYEQFRDYINLKTHLPSLHIIKQNNIHQYREEYGFNVFIETGTYLGDMIDAQQNHFKELYSVELSPELYQNALNRFNNFPNVHLLQGDSGVVLKDIVNEINEPALFWLDGHYSSGITAKAAKNTPILNELQWIFESDQDHGILIDDARLFVGKDDYPSMDEIALFISQKDPTRRMEVADDIIRIFRK